MVHCWGSGSDALLLKVMLNGDPSWLPNMELG